LKVITKFIEMRATMGIMTIMITQGTRVICVQSFEFLAGPNKVTWTSRIFDLGNVS